MSKRSRSSHSPTLRAELLADLSPSRPQLVSMLEAYLPLLDTHDYEGKKKVQAELDELKGGEK